MTRLRCSLAVVTAAMVVSGCHRTAEPKPPRASGYVEATEVKVSSKVPGHVQKVTVNEGQRVTAGEVLVTIDPVDIDLALGQARAERDQVAAQLRLLLAGSRPEDIRQAEAQLAAANSEKAAADAELASAKVDETRFQQLVHARAGAEKQRDDAVARREQAEAAVKAAADRVGVAAASLSRVKAGARPEEIESARARVAAADASIATLQNNRTNTTIQAPSGGIVSSRLVEPGELVAVGVPLIVIVDLDHAWANAYVEEPLVPSLSLNQAATVVTDAGDRLAGRISFISPSAEFTPRNVQTADERAKLVYRVKVAVDNTKGVLKPGMPVEVELATPGAR